MIDLPAISVRARRPGRSPPPSSGGIPIVLRGGGRTAKLRLVEAHLGSRHRDTVKRIFARPTSHNIEWREVVSLLDAIGTVTHEHNGKLRVLLGSEAEVLPAPHGKDVDVQIVVDLRRMLKEAGFAPDGSPPIADQRTRDHGDGQWGEQSEQGRSR